jgi:hypothetical protein
MIKARKGLLYDSQTTPTGFFVKRPKNVFKSEYKVSISEWGEVVYYIKKRHEIIVPLRKKGLADNPQAEIKRAIGKRRPVKVRMFIDGFDGHEMFSPEEFTYYMINLWLPERDEDIPSIKLKLIYHDKPSTKSKPRRAARPKAKASKTVRRH